MSTNRVHSSLYQNSVISGMDESPAELLMSRKLRTRLLTSKSLLQPQPRSTSQIRHNLLTRQQRQKAFYYRGTRPLSKLHEGEPERMKRGREWTPVVAVKQHQAPRLYLMATPDGTRMRRNRFNLQPTEEEASPAHTQHGKKQPVISQILVCNQTLMLVSKYQKQNNIPIFRRRNNPLEEVYGFEAHHSVLLKQNRILSIQQLYTPKTLRTVNEPCLLVGS